MEKQDPSWRRALGWTACSLSTVTASFWAFWGVLENFHEGWSSPSFVANLQLMLVQYLSPALIFVSLAAIALRWPWVGGLLHVAFAFVLGRLFFHAVNSTVFQICMALALLGVMYVFGRARPIRRAYTILVGLPLLVGVVCAVEPVIRVSGRHSGTDPAARIVEMTDGTKLVWAPRGPGWPNEQVNWDEATHRCVFLRDDGLALADTPQNIWRLPSVEEAVHSQMRHGVNAGGVWSQEKEQARYRTLPDKEPPLWDSYSNIIYYWTQTTPAPDRAYAIAFNGRVAGHRKRFPGAGAFRAVRQPPK